MGLNKLPIEGSANRREQAPEWPLPRDRQEQVHIVEEMYRRWHRNESGKCSFARKNRSVCVEVDVPHIEKDTQVLIKVKSCGVCGSGILSCYGKEHIISLLPSVIFSGCGLRRQNKE